jgi:hypothetical protein
MRDDDKYEFVKNVLFAGLQTRNTCLDSPLTPHVSPEEFRTVIDRCEATQTEVIGIEVFDVSKKPVEMIDVVISPEPGLDWARQITGKYTGQPGVTLCATFRMENEPPPGTDDVSLMQALGGVAAEPDGEER